MNRNDHKWLLFAVITLLTWGVWGECSEWIQQLGMSSGTVYVVWALSMIPCAAAAWLLGGRRIDRSPRALLLGLATGLLGAGGQLLLFEALRHGPAYIVFPFVSMSPVVTIALSLLLLGERANRIQSFGILTALAAIFFLSWQEEGGGPAEGFLWLVLAATVFVSWGIQGYIMKFANRSMSAESIFFYMALTAVALIPAARFFIPDSELETISAGLLLKGFFTQMLNAVGALTLVYAYRYGKAIIVSPMQGLAPLITMVLSLALFAVVPGPMLTTGLVLATVALILLSLE